MELESGGGGGVDGGGRDGGGGIPATIKRDLHFRWRSFTSVKT